MTQEELKKLYDDSVSELSDSEGMKLAKRIEQLFKDRCSEFKNKYNLNFGVYFTPKHQWAA